MERTPPKKARRVMSFLVKFKKTVDEFLFRARPTLTWELGLAGGRSVH